MKYFLRGNSLELDNYDGQGQVKSEDNQQNRSLRLPQEGIHPKHRLSSRSSSIRIMHDDIQDTLLFLLDKQKELERDQWVTNHWRAITTKIDKILFYIFLFLTIISILGLLVVVPLFRTIIRRNTKLWHGSRHP